jgi:OOP family OmpA-OmpF porin
MSRMLRACIAGALVAALPLAASVSAQTLTEQQMVEKLSGKPTRAVTVPTSEADVVRLRTLLQRSRTRAFSAKERSEVAELTAPRPSLDFEIYFPFNSSSLQDAAMPTLQRIGQLLTNPTFKDRGFLIAGHTDAKGRAHANRVVSERRAGAVKTYLVKTFGIDPARLQVIGYGKEQLKEPQQPFAAVNRRVQIINLPDGTLAATASR